MDEESAAVFVGHMVYLIFLSVVLSFAINSAIKMICGYDTGVTGIFLLLNVLWIILSYNSILYKK